MAEDNGEKSEEATPHKRQKAREQGNVARSKDFNTALAMCGVAAILWLTGSWIAERLGLMMLLPFDQVQTTLSREDAINRLIGIASLYAIAVLPVLAIMFGVVFFANAMQVGFLWSSEALTPKIERLNPITNAKQILSLQALMKLAISFGKLTLLGSIAVTLIWTHLPAFSELTHASISEISSAVGNSAALLAAQLAGALVLLGLADLAFQRWKYEQDLRMSMQEIREEMKEMEGDPYIRHRRKEIHRKLAEQQEMAAVPTADVVVANPTHYSIAVKYDVQTMAAPRVVAKGVDEFALRIREVAREHNVPIVERAPLARRLWAEVETGHEIPVDLYQTFVEVLQYVYKLRGKVPKRPRKRTA